MKDVQREALQIETEMERRFSEMLNRNSQRKYLPRSLADEVQTDGEQASFQQIRAAITQRLGGPFDYARLQGELKGVQAELSQLRQEFKQQQLHQPEFKDKADRLPEFDFSMPAIPATSLFAAQEQQVKVSYQKPKNLQLIQTQASIIDCDFPPPQMQPVKQPAKNPEQPVPQPAWKGVE